MATLIGDRERTIVAMATARSWRDPKYKMRLMAQPKSVLAEEGLDFPEGTVVEVIDGADPAEHRNSNESVRYIRLGDAPASADLITTQVENDDFPSVLILLLTS
jgi:hypothetical protein